MDKTYLKFKAKNLGRIILGILPMIFDGRTLTYIDDELIPDSFIGNKDFQNKSKKREYKSDKLARLLGVNYERPFESEQLSEQEIHNRLVEVNIVEPNQKHRTKRIIKGHFHRDCTFFNYFEKTMTPEKQLKYRLHYDAYDPGSLQG